MSTQKELKNDITGYELKITDFKDFRKNIPGYLEKERELSTLKKQYFIEVDNQIDQYEEWIRKSKKELKDLKEKNKIVIPHEINKWWSEYGRGVNFGYGGLNIVWISEDKEWVIITSKGGTAGTGTPMGAGGYYYAKAEHFLACTKWGSWIDRPGNAYGTIEGRLTKEAKQKLIDSIPYWKENGNKSKY